MTSGVIRGQKATDKLGSSFKAVGVLQIKKAWAATDEFLDKGGFPSILV